MNSLSILGRLDKMLKKTRKPKDKPLKVTLEYEPTPDGEERFSRVFEFLLF